MEITGKILKVTENEQISDKLTKRLLIVEYAENPHYPETISFEAVNTKTALLDNLRSGQQVTVHFNLKGREYNGKYYNTLSIWKVDFLGNYAPQYAAPSDISSKSDDDDLPF